MKKQFIKTLISTSLLILFFITLPSLNMKAQMRTRTALDSAQAAANGYWYNPNNYQFEVQYPKLQQIPPLSTGMDYETLLTYVFLDSLMRNTNPDMLYQLYLNRWNKDKVKNDTIVNAIKYMYKLKDYDPIRFVQYMQSTGNAYTANLNYLDGTCSRLLSKIFFKTPNPIATSISDLKESDYILRVHVNSINVLPKIEYPNKQIQPDHYIYQVNASVIDTLKGKVFQQCSYIQPKNKKKNSNKPQIDGSNLCFNYGTGPYANDESSFKVDSLLLDGSGNLSLQAGQDLIVCLEHLNYLEDFDYDYFSLFLIRAIPIINEQVRDIANIWSGSTLLNYSDWKVAFKQRRDILFTGGY